MVSAHVQLVATSNPSPRIAYFDERTSFDRLRLTSTRVLGHGLVDPDTPESPEAQDEAEDAPVVAPVKAIKRRHILVTGGFGTLGKHVIRDMLLGLGGENEMEYKSPANGWRGKDDEMDSSEEDIMITLLDTVDRTEELNFLLHNSATDSSPLVKGTDPRTSAFTSSERSVGNFRRSGKLRLVLGDVRDEKLIKSVLSSDVPIPEPATTKRRPKGRPHPGNVEAIPPVTGIIHLAAYSPTDCRVNPVDCESVETGGMDSILKAFAREAVDSLGVQSIAGRAGIADRPWVVVPRRQQGWAHVRSLDRMYFVPLLIILLCSAGGLLPLQRLARLAHRLKEPPQGLFDPTSTPFASPHSSLATFFHW